MSGTAEAAADATTKVQTFGRRRLTPGTYTLEWDVLTALALKVDGNECGFADAYCKLRDGNIKEMPDGVAVWGDKYVTDAGDVHIAGDWRQVYLLRKLLALHRQGINPFEASWFYYDHDWSRDADELHLFFVMHGEKIVDERFSFSHDDPLALKRYENTDPIWNNEPDFDSALESYRYRKFYTETLTGQLMVLRPDEPLLYHYARPARDVTQDVHVVIAAKTYYLLWIAIPLLAAIAFPRFRNYMAVAAIACALQWVLVSWRTRKIGEP